MTRVKSDFLFVYSSLRKSFHPEGQHFVSQYFEFLGLGKVKGLLKDSGTEPVAVPAADEVYIKGELYKLKDPTHFSYVIGQLDEYEGVVAEAGETALYRRELATVYSQDTEPVMAWIYWYNMDTSSYKVIPSGDIMDYTDSHNE